MRAASRHNQSLRPIQCDRTAWKRTSPGAALSQFCPVLLMLCASSADCGHPNTARRPLTRPAGNAPDAAGYIAPTTKDGPSSYREIVSGEFGQHRLDDEIDERRRHVQVELAIGIGTDMSGQSPHCEP